MDKKYPQVSFPFFSALFNPFSCHKLKPVCAVLSIAMLALISNPVLAQCPPENDPGAFGDNVWKLHGYDLADITLATAIYAGSYTQNTLGFDTQAGTNSWPANTSPSAAEGWSGCTLPADHFTMVYKRKGFPCGSYTVSLQNWDDAAIVYIDGVAQWSCSDPSDEATCSGYVGIYDLDEDSEMEIRIQENTGGAFAALSITDNTVAGTLATSQNVICRNTKPHDIMMTDYSGIISKWQSADDAGFTSGVIDIASPLATLTGNDIGPIAASRYFRAVLANGGCGVKNTNPILIIVPDAVVYGLEGWDGPIDPSSSVIISDNFTLTTDLHVCSCEISGAATLTVSSGVALTVTHGIKVMPSGNMIIENNGSLFQIDDNAENFGNITVMRNTTTMKQYDFTYWSSPVQNWKLQQLSPLTLSDKYYSFNPVTNGWASHPNGDQVMEPGKGYIVRAPQGWSQTNGTSGVFGGVFSGTPNTGIVPVTIQKSTSAYNLIGNPYPSSIDLDVFLTDAANTGIINGTVYLWTHNTAINNTIPGNQVYNYTRDDYAKYNITGGVKTASAAVNGGAAPTGKIASGQGFFIEANTALPNGTYTATFNNSMRVIDNTPFFRASSQAMPNSIEKHRFWLHLSNTTGAYAEMLAGYIAGATDDFDNMYDGKTFPAGNVVGLYSVLDGTSLSIQGRALPFATTDVIPLGYNSSVAGTFSIGLENVDGLFTEQDIYLFDKTDETYHNLKQGDYVFTTDTGTFDSRFEIHFRLPEVLGVQPVSSQTVFISAKEKKISVHSENATISTIEVFDLDGKTIYTKKGIRENAFTTSYINCGVKVLVVQATLDDQRTIAKKIIME